MTTRLPPNPMVPTGFYDEYRRLGLQHGLHNHVGGPTHVIKILRKALDALPRNPLAPGIDLALVKILFDQKDQAHEKAADELEILENLVQVIDRELSRNKENIDRLRQDQAMLHRQQIKGHYSQVVQRHMEQFQFATAQKKTILDLLAALRALLRESQNRKYEKETQELLQKPKQGRDASVRRGGE